MIEYLPESYNNLSLDQKINWWFDNTGLDYTTSRFDLLKEMLSIDFNDINNIYKIPLEDISVDQYMVDDRYIYISLILSDEYKCTVAGSDAWISEIKFFKKTDDNPVIDEVTKTGPPKLFTYDISMFELGEDDDVDTIMLLNLIQYSNMNQTKFHRNLLNLGKSKTRHIPLSYFPDIELDDNDESEIIELLSSDEWAKVSISDFTMVSYSRLIVKNNYLTYKDKPLKASYVRSHNTLWFFDEYFNITHLGYMIDDELKIINNFDLVKQAYNEWLDRNGRLIPFFDEIAPFSMPKLEDKLIELTGLL